MWLPAAFALLTVLMSILVGLSWATAGWMGVTILLAVIGIALWTIVKGDIS